MYSARGPLFDAGRPAALHRLVDELRSEARRSRAIVLRCARPASGDDVRALDALHGAGFVTPSRPAAAWVQTQVLDLRPPEEHLWRQVRRRMRDYVGAARRRGLVVEASTRAEDFEAFRHVLANAGRLKGFEVRPAAYYRAVHAAYGDRAVLLVARGDDRVVGGLLALRFGRSAFMLHMSARSDGDVLRHHVAPALYWALVRWAKDAGCDLLDFGPSAVQLPPRESDPGWGVFHFKAGFGAELTTYQPPVDLVFRAAPYRVLRVIERLAVSRPMHLGRRSLTATGDVLRRLRPVAA
jgi:lipid II:glycine glycyltransferase (peptidoglycan interpeptide bridge formation enzyme)